MGASAGTRYWDQGYFKEYYLVRTALAVTIFGADRCLRRAVR